MTYRHLLIKLQNLTDAQLNQEIKVRCSKSGVGAASTEGSWVALKFDGIDDSAYDKETDVWPVDTANPVIVIN
jgi:hypothetical protein